MSYDKNLAVSYAHAWAYSRNPQWHNFDTLGGDCTNFISQCLFAGCGAMTFGKNGWYFRSLRDRAPSWSGVEPLYEFLTRANGADGLRAKLVPLGDVRKGDVIQLSFDGLAFSHSLLVVEREGGIFVAAHSLDSDYRRLETYTFRTSRALAITY